MGVFLSCQAFGRVLLDQGEGRIQRHQREQWRERTVLSRFGSTQEIAAAVGCLLSDEAAFSRGSELLIDGGYSLH